jgi:predicted ATPase with chaperone activity
MAQYIGKIPYKATVAPICECGGEGSPKFECTCSLKRIEKHHKRMMLLVKDMEMFVETVMPKASDTSKHEEGSEEFLNRVMEEMKNPVPTEVGAGVEDFLRMAITELGADRVKVLNIAKTIAKMDNSLCVNEVHVAEACQYVRNPFGRYVDQYQEVTV